MQCALSASDTVASRGLAGLIHGSAAGKSRLLRPPKARVLLTLALPHCRPDADPRLCSRPGPAAGLRMVSLVLQRNPLGFHRGFSCPERRCPAMLLQMCTVQLCPFITSLPCCAAALMK